MTNIVVGGLDLWNKQRIKYWMIYDASGIVLAFKDTIYCEPLKITFTSQF